jgi:hypothetical protein
MKTIRTMVKKTSRSTALLAASAMLTACNGPRLETRTFRVEHLPPHEVSELLAPYVFGDREGAPGSSSAIDGAITVRETKDNLERIGRVLTEFDRPRSDVRLFFQLIEADGFTESDPRIAEVEEELRKLFQFRGYRLAAETTVTATNMSNIRQGMQAADGQFHLQAFVSRVGSDLTRLSDVMLSGEDGWSLGTSVNVRNGQTIVLGSSPMSGSSATLFLTVRAEQGDSLGEGLR